MKVISEAVAKWQVERLESLIAGARSRAKANKLKGGSLVLEHLDLADEHLDEAVSAMKYHKYEQASYACQSGFVQLGLAELLLKYGAKIDAGIKASAALGSKNERVAEEEELAHYLASCLAEMKVCIEYSNCKVSVRSQSVLDRAMDNYNDALASIKCSEPQKAKCCAQAGLLCLLLASELIGAENQMALPGWRGLSNPMLSRELRRAPELARHLAETRQRLHLKEKISPEELSQEESDQNMLLRKHWERAFNEFMLAVQSHANGSVSHAQALLKSALREMELCLEIVGIEDPEDFAEEFEDAQEEERVPVVDALCALDEAGGILSELKIPRKEYLLNCLEKVARLYKEAMRAYERNGYQRAEKALSEALLELDLVRQQIQMRRQKNTMQMSKD